MTSLPESPRRSFEGFGFGEKIELTGRFVSTDASTSITANVFHNSPSNTDFDLFRLGRLIFVLHAFDRVAKLSVAHVVTDVTAASTNDVIVEDTVNVVANLAVGGSFGST